MTFWDFAVQHPFVASLIILWAGAQLGSIGQSKTKIYVNGENLKVERK